MTETAKKGGDNENASFINPVNVYWDEDNEEREIFREKNS